MNIKKMQKAVHDQATKIANLTTVKPESFTGKKIQSNHLHFGAHGVRVTVHPNLEQVSNNEQAGIKDEYPIEYTLTVWALDEKELLKLLKVLNLTKRGKKQCSRK